MNTFVIISSATSSRNLLIIYIMILYLEYVSSEWVMIEKTSRYLELLLSQQCGDSNGIYSTCLIWIVSLLHYRSGSVQHLKQDQCPYTRGYMTRKVRWEHPKKKGQFCRTAHSLTRSRTLPWKQSRQEEQLKV